MAHLNISARAAALAALLATACASVQAAALPDPTRPPADLAASSAGTVPAAIASDRLHLQSVLLGRGRTPAAVISGELVLLGGRVGDARLVRVTEHGAVLRGPQGDTTLALTPQASKQGRTAATSGSEP